LAFIQTFIQLLFQTTFIPKVIGKSLGPWAIPKSGLHEAMSSAGPYSGKAHGQGLYCV